MADPCLYRITYDTGKVKYGPRRVLGPVLAAMRKANWWYIRPVKIERLAVPGLVTDPKDGVLYQSHTGRVGRYQFDGYGYWTFLEDEVGGMDRDGVMPRPLTDLTPVAWEDVTAELIPLT